MNIASIKGLVEGSTMSELRAAADALLEEREPSTTIPGEDEAEQFTHVLAAIYIQEKIAEHGMDITTAIRDYTTRVRNSIT